MAKDEKDLPPHVQEAFAEGGSVLTHGPTGSVIATTPEELPEGWDKPAPVAPVPGVAPGADEVAALRAEIAALRQQVEGGRQATPVSQGVPPTDERSLGATSPTSQKKL